jgi:hypothetical protein
MLVPGLFMSKLLATRKIGLEVSSLWGISSLQSSSKILLIFISCCADTGIIGAFSAIVPLTNSFIFL